MSQKGSKRKGNLSDTPLPADLPHRKTTTAVVHRYPDKKGTLEGILGYPFSIDRVGRRKRGEKFFFRQTQQS